MCPVRSSRHKTRSVPFVPVSREKSSTNTRPSATAGPENPEPMGVRQATVSPCGGKLSTIPDSFHRPRRPLPRHSGQSSARTGSVHVNKKQTQAKANRISSPSVREMKPPMNTDEQGSELPPRKSYDAWKGFLLGAHASCVQGSETQGPALRDAPR